MSDEPPQLAAIRAEARAWLEEHFPAWRTRTAVEGPPPWPLDAERAWQRELADGGWGAPMWPQEYGGRGFGPVESSIWAEEKARVGAASTFNVVGFGMAGPTIASLGTPEQKQRYLPPLLRGDEIWCQLFSEPAAGSDLASVRTRAVREGDTWIVNGQKVWSSGADAADFGILLARHDPALPKRKGLVYLIVDMRTPGVDVRPLRQISGESHFSEVFLTDVRVPDENRIGEPGEGWKVAATTLLHERMSLGAATAGLTFPFTRLVEIARARATSANLDPLVRDDLVRIWARERLLDGLNKRIVAKIAQGQIPESEGSVLKLMLSGLSTDAANTGMRLLGMRGGVMADDGPQLAWLWSPALRIGGGTDEIQRNVIAERVLGLPREPEPDRDAPFSEVTS